MNSPPSLSFSRDSRGQLLLLGGLVILVSLSILVLVLNTVLYTSNVESREVAPEVDLAENYADTLEQQYSTVIEKENSRSYASQSTAVRETQDSLLAANRLLGAHFAETQGVYATINPFRVTNATVVQQTDATCTFESADANCNSGGGNTRPTADFSATPSSAETGDMISFDASSSSDPDGSIVSYEWDFDGDGTVDATGQSLSYSYGSSGTYDVVLTVTDDSGDSDSNTQTISVSDPAGNTAPTADFSYSPSAPDAKEDVTFDGSASVDSDGSISTYNWDFDGDGSIDATGQTVTTSFNPQGDYSVTLTVVDDDGATATTTKTLTVTKKGGGGGKGKPFSIAPAPELNTLVSAGSTTDWTLATTSAFRNFEFSIAKSAFTSSITTTSPLDQTILRADAFHIRLDGSSGNTQRVYLFRSTTDRIVVASQLNNAPIEQHYREDVSELDIDLTTGMVNGGSTSLDLTRGLSGPIEISFRNGAAAQGTYKLVLPDDPSASTTIQSGNFNTAPNTNSPFLSRGVYSVRVDLTFNLDGISFTTKKTIAPDEPEGFSP